MSVARSLLAAALLAIPRSAIAQIPWPASKPATAKDALPAGRSTLRLAAASTATVSETEPNDLVSQAKLVTLGDTASGVIGETLDLDTYAIDLVAGTKVVLDVLAQRAGSPLDATLTLIGPDGESVLAFNDDDATSDSHIEFFIFVTGRYFVQIQSFNAVGSAAAQYHLSFDEIAGGPGDPVSPYATGLDVPYQMAAGSAGELYVTDVGSTRLLRLAPTGEVTELAAFPDAIPVGVVVDGFGDVLVSSVARNFASGKIERFSRGQRTTFAFDLQAGATLTVGPDGDVWVIDPIARVLRRYDPNGAPNGTVSLSTLTHFAFDMGLAFSPAGDLYVSDGFSSIYKIVGGTPQLVFRADPFLNGLAFDQDGFLYVANGSRSRVLLLDPTLRVVENPFALSYASGSTHLAFLRGTNGAMTRRLVADNIGLGALAAGLGGIGEMNPAGMRAAGFRVGVDLLHIANATLVDGVVGADYAETLQLVAAPATPTWSVSSGALPPGLRLSADGRITGIPTQAGAFAFDVRADAGGQLAVRSFTVTVSIPAVSADAAAADLLGGAALDLTRRRFLDLQGNRNGNFDLGDFRAFLRAIGQLPAPAGKENP